MEQLTLDIGTVKQEIRDRLNQAAQDFVFIGYRLRQILDSGAYAQDGYSDIYAFAKEEFGLGVSTVSRFMAINKKYSVGGYGEELRIEYQNYGSSKLSEMLTLSDEDLALIDEKTPVSQIREIKGFLKNEPKEEIAGQQSFMNAPEIDETAAGGGNIVSHELKPLLADYFTSHTEILKAIFRGIDTESLYEEMNITGTGVIKYRTTLLTMHDFEHGIVYRVFGRPTPEKLSWAEFHEIIKTNLASDYESIMEAAAAKEAEEREIEKAKAEAEQKVKEEKKQPAKTEKKEVPKTKPDATPQEPITVEVVPGVGAVVEDVEKATAAAEENKLLGETLAAPGYTREEPADATPQETEPVAVVNEPVEVITDAEVVDERHVACEVDYSFNERIQIATDILDCVRKDDKASARLYCRDLLRLLGDMEG